MLAKNQSSQGCYLFAYNTSTNAPDTGDAANITGTQSLDGATPGTAFATTHPTEIGGGVYWQPLSQGETNGNAFAYRWTTSTSNVQIAPVIGYTTGATLPAVALGNDGALPTCGTTGNAHQLFLSSGGGVNAAQIGGTDATAQSVPVFDNGAIASASSTTSFTSTSVTLHAQSGGYSGMALLFTSGVNQGEKRTIQSHVLSAGTHTFTMASGFTGTPSATDTFFVG